MLVLEERIGRDFTQIARNAADRQIHLGQFIGRAGLLLTVDRNVFLISLMVLDKLDRLHEHTATTAAGVIDLAAVRLDHFSDQIDDAFGRIELAAPFALGRRELAQKIFVNSTDNIFF